MATISNEEWAWRAWFLGEGVYKPYGRRNLAQRNKTGAPARIPDEWWVRFETFLSKRENAEVPPALPKFPSGGPGGATKLSEHFSAYEFDCHDGRKTPELAYPALVQLAAVFLEPLRARFGSVYVTSGYRPEDYNRKIGGAPFSQHIYELGPGSVAADLIPKQGTPQDWAHHLRGIADWAKLGGVGLYAAFVHVDNGPRRDW